MNTEDQSTLRSTIAEFDSALDLFHAAVRADPEVWRDTTAVREAWKVSVEREQVVNALHRLYLLASHRDPSRRLSISQSEGLSESEQAPAEPMEPDRLHLIRLLEAQGTVVNATMHLRRLTDGVASYDQDLARRAFLSYVLEVLAGVQPGMAEEIREVWAQRRVQGTTMVAYAELWEQRTTEQLVRLLAPLLEARFG
ncbi:MAG: hypothetical protein M3Z66_10010 [Chloroflexota bacterium]|nr:hypothetical protein [Chloroflexota bacterium]